MSEDTPKYNTEKKIIISINSEIQKYIELIQKKSTVKPIRSQIIATALNRGLLSIMEEMKIELEG